MRLLAVLTVFILLVAGMSAFATDTRVLTLGENNMILIDEANVSLFPSRLYDFQNLVVGEFGRVDYGEGEGDVEFVGDDPEFKQFGVHWKFGTENPIILGTYFHNSEFSYPGIVYRGNPITDYGMYPFPDLYFPDYYGDDESYLRSNKKVDLYVARQFGDNVAGLHIGKVGSSWEYEAEDINPDMSYGVYSFDFGMTMMDGQFDWSVGMDITSFSITNSAGNDLLKPSGSTAFNMHARYFYTFNPIYTVIPHASLSFGKLGAEYYNNLGDETELDETEELSMSQISFGCGLQSTPVKNVLIILDVGVMFDQIKATYEEAGEDELEMKLKNNAFPYFKAGFDADVYKWLDVRFGAVSYWDSQKYEDEDEEMTWSYANNQTYVGLGFHFNRLHIDTRLDPNLILDGFNFISGEDNSMNWQVSAAYEF